MCTLLHLICVAQAVVMGARYSTVLLKVSKMAKMPFLAVYGGLFSSHICKEDLQTMQIHLKADVCTFYMDCTTPKKATAALISHVVGIEPFNMVSWAHLGHIVGGFWGLKS